MLHGKNIDPKRAVAGGMGGREPIKKIFVGGLDPNLTEEEIIEHFSQYGKVNILILKGFEFNSSKSTADR